MQAQSNLIQDKIWVREIENGIRHITLRRNFAEGIWTWHDGNGLEEKQYTYEETNIYIIDRENIKEYVESNFDVLFEQGLLQENKPIEPSVDDRIMSLEKALVGLM